MAQTKHTFIESKMNKDLDDRLLSGGQYRDAMNVAVSKSEDSDVGALENILGNKFISTLQQVNDEEVINAQVIGSIVSNEKDSIYVFLTNYCDNSPNGMSNPATSGAYCAIVEYNVLTSTCHKLVQGSFLNFSTSKYITGINIIEDLLFWTDDRNQPRKINIVTARENFNTTPYYTTEDQISVSKYSPVFPPNILTVYTDNSVFWDDYDWNPWGNIDDGSGITTIPSTAFSETIIQAWPLLNDLNKYDKFAIEGENQIFEIADFVENTTTGEREQIVVYPRLTNTNPTGSGNVGKKITVYKNKAVDATQEYLPVSARIKVINTNPNLQIVSANTIIDFNTSNLRAEWLSPRVSWAMLSNNVDQASISTGNWVGCGIYGNAIDENKYDSNNNRLNHIRFTQANNTSFKPSGFAIQQELVLDQGQEIYLDLRLPNPHYEPQFAGDKNNLKEKFVRFAYRYKFDDNEYSILSPFTQPVFIPEQDGYMLNQVQRFNSGLTDGLVNQQDSAGTETVLSWFENKVNRVGLNIPFEFNVNEINDKLKVKELQVVYKESDELALKVLDDVDFTVNNVDVVNNSTKVYEYNYQSAKPFKTLPDSVITRTSDKVPLRALAQESAGNRIIYGNFVDKHTSPLTLNYLVSVGEKLGPIGSGTINSFAEYPNHTLKQNRTYQVGVVLQDRYGRQTDVILAQPLVGSKIESPLGSGNFYGDSTIYHEYKPQTFNGTSKVYDWTGDSLKVLFRNIIPEEITRPGYPGLYSEDNPLGFYSYKIVVKQKQQDYYNVYLPSLLYGVPLDGQVEVAWSSENSVGNFTPCNNPNPSNGVNTADTVLNGLDDTSLLKEGMKFRLQANTFDNFNQISGCQLPASPCPNACGGSPSGTPQAGLSQCATYTITKVIDSNSIEFFPPSLNIYYPYCEDTSTGNFPGNNCCDKRPVDNLGNPDIPTDSVRNSQPKLNLTFSNGGDIVLRPNNVNNPDEMTTTLLTDNINKMPADLSEVRPNQNQFATSDKIYYSRVAMNQGGKFVITDASGQIPGTSLVYPSQVNTGTDADVVKVLADWNDLFSDNNIETGLYKTSTNPFTSILSNVFQIGSTTEESQTFAVIETEPVISELDIFWETTSAGLISDLNQSVREIEELAGIGGSTEFFQPEDLNPSPTNPAVVGKVYGVSGLGAIIPTSITLLTVKDGNNNNLNSAYEITPVAGTNDYEILAKEPCVFIEDNLTNQRVFTFEVTDQQPSPPGNGITNVYSFVTSISNTFPLIEGYSADPTLGQDGYPNNPNSTKINVNIGGFFPPISSWGCLGLQDYDITNQLIFDNKIYVANGSAASFIANGQSPNEYSETTLSLEVSLSDPAEGGNFIPVTEQVNTYTLGNNQGSGNTQYQISSTGALIPINQLFTNPLGVGGSTTITYSSWEGFSIVKLSNSSPTNTLPQYGIPNGVQGWGIVFRYNDYTSSDPGIRDNTGQLRIDPNTNQPYIESGPAAVLQDFASGWLLQRYIRVVVRDANGSALSLQTSTGSNIAGQTGIKFEFEALNTPSAGIMQTFSVANFVHGPLNTAYNPLFHVTNQNFTNQIDWCCGGVPFGVSPGSAGYVNRSDAWGADQAPGPNNTPAQGNPFSAGTNFIKFGN